LPYGIPRRALNWSADSTLLYDAGEADGQAVIFALNVNDGTVQELIKLPVEQVAAFTISPDATKLAIAGDGIVRILEASSGDVRMEFPSVPEPVDLAWNPNGNSLAVLDYKTTLQLWDVKQ
jgi:WD40 repeat protein